MIETQIDNAALRKKAEGWLPAAKRLLYEPYDRKAREACEGYFKELAEMSPEERAIVVANLDETALKMLADMAKDELSVMASDAADAVTLGRQQDHSRRTLTKLLGFAGLKFLSPPPRSTLSFDPKVREQVEKDPRHAALSGLVEELTTAKKEAVERENADFKQYAKNGGEMSLPQFENVKKAVINEGHRFQASLMIQDVHRGDPDDAFLETCARLIATFEGNTEKMNPRWLVAETYILLGRTK